MKRILIVGSGITSGVTASLLRLRIPSFEILVWDKAKGAGGRMSTTRNNDCDKSILDLGAQYVSATSEYKQNHSRYYKELSDMGLLVPLNRTIGGMKESSKDCDHYVAPHGMSSIVKYYLNKSNARIDYNRTVEWVTEADAKWEVGCADGARSAFDVVVLTMPVPQVLALSGSIQKSLEENGDVFGKLKAVDYSSRFALGLFFKKDAIVRLENDDCGQYFPSDPILRFVSIDSLKRGSGDICPSVVAHTSVTFGKANVEKSREHVHGILLDRLKTLFPHWPAPASSKCHKWRYSQVTNAYAGSPGAVEIERGLFVTGDAFTHSNFDGCIQAAEVASAAVASCIGNS